MPYDTFWKQDVIAREAFAAQPPTRRRCCESRSFVAAGECRENDAEQTSSLGWPIIRPELFNSSCDALGDVHVAGNRPPVHCGG